MASCRKQSSEAMDSDDDDFDDEAPQEFADFQKWLDQVNRPVPSSSGVTSSLGTPPAPAPAATAPSLCSKCQKTDCRCFSSQLQVSNFFGVVTLAGSLYLFPFSLTGIERQVHCNNPFLSQPLFAKVPKMLNVCTVFGNRLCRSWLCWRMVQPRRFSLDWGWISDGLATGPFWGPAQFFRAHGYQWRIKKYGIFYDIYTPWQHIYELHALRSLSFGAIYFLLAYSAGFWQIIRHRVMRWYFHLQGMLLLAQLAVPAWALHKAPGGRIGWLWWSRLIQWNASLI